MIKKFKWVKIGTVSTPKEIYGLRFIYSDDWGGLQGTGGFGCYGYNFFNAFTFYKSGNNSFGSINEYQETILDLVSAWPTSRQSRNNFVYRKTNQIFAKYQNSGYTLESVNSGQSIGGLDVNEEYVAYSYTNSPGSTPYLKFGKLFQPVSNGLGVGCVMSTGIKFSRISISRNGAYVTGSGFPAGGSIRNTIQIFGTSNGNPPPANYFSAIQVGGDVTIPGSENIEDVKINDNGTLIVVCTYSTLYTYTFNQGAWTLRASISTTQSQGQLSKIAISGDGSILSARGKSMINSYLWNSYSNSWDLFEVTDIYVDQQYTTYFGNTIDLSADAMYMAVDMWPTTNSTAIEIYKRVDILPLYAGLNLATSIYAGATEGKSLYAGNNLLWQKT